MVASVEDKRSERMKRNGERENAKRGEGRKERGRRKEKKKGRKVEKRGGRTTQNGREEEIGERRKRKKKL